MQDFRMDTFLAVCRYMNYTKAAHALCITQPAVSQHIRYLEKHYGTRLFEYRGKKLSMTEAGRVLYAAGTTMKQDERILLEQMKKGEQEKLVFGATRTIGDFVFPGLINRYLKKHPDAEMRMLVDNTQHLLRAIDEGEIDFALIEGYFNKSEYEYKIYSDERYIAVCSADYAFSDAPSAVSNLFDERIILREPGSGTREILERHMNQRNYSVDNFSRITEVGSIHAIKLLVAEGCGITFLYEAAVKRELEAGTLIKIPLTDFEISHNFTAVYRKNSIFNERYSTMIALLLGEEKKDV